MTSSPPPSNAPASSKHTHPCISSPPVQFLYGVGQLSTNAFWWQLGMQDLLSSQPLPTENFKRFSWLVFCALTDLFLYICNFLFLLLPSLPGAVQ